MSHVKISDQEIISRDPLLRWLCLKRNLTNLKIILGLSLLSGLAFLVVGNIASAEYQGSGNRILHVGNLGFFVVWLLIFVPMMWGAFLWQARSAPALFLGLMHNGIFGESDSTHYRQAAEQIRQTLNLMCRRLTYVVVILALVLFWLNELLSAWPEQFRINSEYWYEVKWYLPIHLLTWSISLYALFLFVLRQIILVFGLSKILRTVQVEIKPLHPDEVGGFGAVGRFINLSILLAVGIGLLAVLFAGLVFVTGADILRRSDVLALFGLYLVLVPLCLFVPYYSARSAMLRARGVLLKPIAEEFQEVLEVAHSKIAAPAKELNDVDERLEQIKKHRDIVLQVCPVSPLSLSAFRNISITASIPFISGVASFVVRFLNK
jgi:hypothetical protein